MENAIYLDEVDSTNSYIKRRLANNDGFADGCAVTARLQTAGRGRLGHDWAANEDMLPLSILFKDPPERENLTARVGLAVCESIESCYDGGTFDAAPVAGIKWANDIIIASRKVCGILCESVFFGDCANVIVGIGVNVSQSADFFETADLPHAASLLMLTGKVPERERLFENIVERVKFRAAMPFAECYGEYKRRVLNLGRQVKIISPIGERVAEAVDVASNGFLVCRDESGVFEVNSGEVSVRGIDGYL